MVIFLSSPRVAGLNHEVPAVPIQAGAVDHILIIFRLSTR